MQEIAHERQQRTYIRLTLGLIVGLVALCFLGWWATRSYTAVREERALKKAEAYAGEGNLKMAALSAKRALQVNQNSAAAARMLAEIAEKSGDKAALEWRRRVTDLAPRSVDDLMKHAAAAIKFEEPALAQKILEGVADRAGTRADYQAASARLATMRQDKTAGRKHWSEAVRLDPANRTYRRELAVSRLTAIDASEQEAGLSALHELRHDPAEALPATRFVVRFGLLSGNDPAETKKLARELQTLAGADFNDRLLLLDVLRRFGDPAFSSELEEAQRMAAVETRQLAMLLEWMNAGGLNLAARQFASGLPREVVAKWPVPWQLAKIYNALTAWTELEQLASTSHWGRMDSLRYAFLARAQRAQDNKVGEEKHWRAAVQEAERNAEALTLLTKTAMEWGWDDRAEDVAWRLASLPAKESRTLRELYQHYVRTGNTPGLYRTLNRLVQLHPSDLILRNNLAQVSLLLQAEVDRARRLSQSTLEAEPENAAFITTAAFGDFIKGDTKAALERMKKMPEGQLLSPEVSVYYGLFLTHAGDLAAAREFLSRADEARLLPEERALVEAARKRADAPL